ncbi:hypothetical protein D3C81_853320 [compost metagenome]
MVNAAADDRYLLCGPLLAPPGCCDVNSSGDKTGSASVSSDDVRNLCTLDGNRLCVAEYDDAGHNPRIIIAAPVTAMRGPLDEQPLNRNSCATPGDRQHPVHPPIAIKDKAGQQSVFARHPHKFPPKAAGPRANDRGTSVSLERGIAPNPQRFGRIDQVNSLGKINGISG